MEVKSLGFVDSLTEAEIDNLEEFLPSVLFIASDTNKSFMFSEAGDLIKLDTDILSGKVSGTASGKATKRKNRIAKRKLFREAVITTSTEKEQQGAVDFVKITKDSETKNIQSLVPPSISKKGVA